MSQRVSQLRSLVVSERPSADCINHCQPIWLVLRHCIMQQLKLI